MSKLQVQRQLIAQVDTELETRDETLYGRNFFVVPVVAMVEGVRFGANQDSPELGLAADFGDIPVLWNNKPLVLNHPQLDGVFVSAGQSKEVLEDYYFGITMNSYVEDGKLKMEAWIDTARVEELGGDFEDVVERIKDGETIEVSVGFYSDVVPSKGKFKGQAYSGIWKNIKPDHLAILPNSTGACSVKDGCGVPRINKEADVSKTTTPVIKTNCSCQDGEHANSETTVQEDEKPFEVVEAEARTQTRAIIQFTVNSMLRAQGVNPEMMDADVRKLLNRALSKAYGSYMYIYGFTSDYVIFEKYTYGDYNGYTTYRQNFNINDTKVEFVGTPEEVVLLTKIVPQSASSGVEDVEQNEATVQTQENDMTKPVVQSADEIAAAAAAAATTAATTEAAKVTEPAPVAQAAPKVLTAEEYLAQAPAGVREMLSSGLRMHSEKKASVIATLKAHPKNKFSDEYLQAQTIEVLENMAELIGQTPNYAGVGAPVAPTAQVGQASGFIDAPKVFTPKAA